MFYIFEAKYQKKTKNQSFENNINEFNKKMVNRKNKNDCNRTFGIKQFVRFSIIF